MNETLVLNTTENVELSLCTYGLQMLVSIEISIVNGENCVAAWSLISWVGAGNWNQQRLNCKINIINGSEDETNKHRNWVSITSKKKEPE